ncbi:MAG: asparagine--tRNA ligase [Candidatus Marinimicrobia bacterium]|nr:asparagine--tRNA ligase [Candidatus Neomarinimicrobiota bacterium]
MEKIFIKNLKKHDGNDVTLNGWVYNVRSIGKIWFLILRDGTGMLQCVVVKNDVDADTFSKEELLTQESSVTVTGVVRIDKRAIGGVELGVKSIKIHQIADEYPISPKEHGTAFLMDNRHLWIRSTKQHAILKVRHQIVKASRDFFDNNDFVLFDSPMLTANAAEGTTSLFNVDYYDRTAYLSQTGQLYGEAGAMAFNRVYVFGPTFRAEKSKTRRHLTEFWMLEPEMAYCDLEENMEWAEKLLVYIVEQCLKNCKEELNLLERDISKLENIKAPFPRLTYDEAVKLLKDNGVDFKYGSDFGGTDETVIAEQFDRPVIVHRWPADIKAFYMKRDADNNDLALGMDVIAPEGYGEIIGGGQREDDHDTLVKRILKQDLPMEPFKWYLDLRKYGSVPHAGFGLGLERTVTWICGIKHIRETIPFPRTMSRLEP